jgi:hypothetical protein
VHQIGFIYKIIQGYTVNKTKYVSLPGSRVVNIIYIIIIYYYYYVYVNPPPLYFQFLFNFFFFFFFVCAD